MTRASSGLRGAAGRADQVVEVTYSLMALVVEVY